MLKLYHILLYLLTNLCQNHVIMIGMCRQTQLAVECLIQCAAKLHLCLLMLLAKELLWQVRVVLYLIDHLFLETLLFRSGNELFEALSRIVLSRSLRRY